MTKIISVRLDEDEVEILDRKVGALGIDRSGYFKMLIREGEIKACLQTNTEEVYTNDDKPKGVYKRTQAKPILKADDLKASKITKGKNELSTGGGMNTNPNYISLE